MSITRRDFVRTASGAAVGALAAHPLLAAAMGGDSAASAKPKNILFIAVDDLRPQLGCYGHKQMISPNIDKLACEGMLMERSYCQVPVCGASRASLLKGLRPTPKRFLGYSTWAEKDAPDVDSLPRTLRKAGYTTISNGKVYHHAKDDLEAWSETPYRPQTGQPWPYYADPKSREILAEHRKTRKRGRGPAFEGFDAPDNQYPDGMIADKTIADIKRLSASGKPFFLACGFQKPHLPFTAPKKYWDLYKREAIDLADNPFRPKGAPDAALHNWGELRQYYGIPRQGPVSDETARSLIHGYYACVSFIDAQLGRVLKALDDAGLRDDTIVVLWGDHGWNLGEHGLWCKHCNFETSLHSPMIWRVPGVDGMKAGQRTAALTEYVDIYPTLCELTGVATPKHVEGLSLVPLMRRPDREWKNAAFSRYYGGDSIRTDRYRYTEYVDREGKPAGRMLYDHEKDPHENVNIADGHAALVTEMSNRLRAGWKEALPK